MKRKTFRGTFLPLMALFLAPILLTLILIACLPPVYENTFLGELGEKYDRLTEDDSKKLVVVAGSSAAFGLDSELLEKATGMKVVNFGLYANLGTKLMMDLSKANVNEGDIYILAPEMNSQTLSLYFNGEAAAQALDGNMGMLMDVSSDNYEALLGAAWSHMSNKVGYALSGTSPENTGAYRKENFNSYGDNIYSRPYKEITGYGNAISFDFGSEFDEFADYVNEYTEYIRSKGGEVYFSFPPMNEDAVYAGSTDDDITEFYASLCRRLDCRVISNIYDYILDGGYFFDSEFHLNDSGVVIRTVQLADDIKRELGDVSVTMALSQLPDPTGDKPDTDELILIKLKDGSGWALSGLTEEGKALKALYLPDEVSGLPIVEIRDGAFDGSSARLIKLSNSINRLNNDSVKNIPSLKALEIPEGVDAEALPKSGMGDGCSDEFKIYVHGSVNDYKYAVDSVVEKAELFTSRAYNNKNGTFYTITGLTELGKLHSRLALPRTVGGLKVGSISAGTFAEADNLLELDMVNSSINILPIEEIKALDGVTVSISYEDYNRVMADPAYAEVMSILHTDNIYFVLSENDDGSLIITGLNEAGMAAEEITVPKTVSGKSVRTIAENAFAGSNVRVLYVGENVSRIDGRAFAGSAIEAVIMPQGVTPDKISLPNNMSASKATDGAPETLAFYVPDEYYEAYAADYFWGDYGSQLRKLSEYK